ncbi:hypothetical protein [Streptomyces nigrescens]|uniref:hypothetical protein n=1 Tax=Streptomyces nigrescens TaxID=1920 RepID=UPI003702FA7A
MNDALDAIEEEMSRLRSEMRAAAETSDSTRINELRSRLHRAQSAWDALLGGPRLSPSPSRPMKSARQQVLQTLTLIGAPAPQKTIRAVHEAFFGATLDPSRMASLRRDEARSYQNSSNPRAYVCPALTVGAFHPARSVLTSSEWPLQQRLLAGDSERVNYLTMAVNLAEAAAQGETTDGGGRLAIDALLHNIALHIPGLGRSKQVDIAQIQAAARRELGRLLPADEAARLQSAQAAFQLPPLHALFGVPRADQSS